MGYLDDRSNEQFEGKFFFSYLYFTLFFLGTVEYSNNNSSLYAALATHMNVVDHKTFLVSHGVSLKDVADNELPLRSLVLMLDLFDATCADKLAEAMTDKISEWQSGDECINLELSREFIHLPTSVVNDEILSRCYFGRACKRVLPINAVADMRYHLGQYDANGCRRDTADNWLLNMSLTLFS